MKNNIAPSQSFLVRNSSAYIFIALMETAQNKYFNIFLVNCNLCQIKNILSFINTLENSHTHACTICIYIKKVKIWQIIIIFNE